MEKDFIIEKAAWHTQRIRDYEFDTTIVYDCIKSIINYLQENGLTSHTILEGNQVVNDETSIKRSDLNEKGFELIKKAYDKWSEKVIDKKILPTDYKMLDKYLKNIS